MDKLTAYFKKDEQVEFEDEVQLNWLDRVSERVSVLTAPLKGTVDRLENVTEKAYGMGRKAVWIAATTSVVVGIPLLFEYEQHMAAGRRR